jgi:HK97 family phage major capsid protein
MKMNTAIFERDELATKIKAFANDQFSLGDKGWSDAASREFAKLNARWDVLNLDLGKSAGLIGRDGGSIADGPRNRQFFNPAAGGTELDNALSAWVRNAHGMPVSEKDSQACERYGVALNSTTFAVKLPTHGPRCGRDWRIQNALGRQDGTSGGYTVAQGFMPSLEKAMVDFSGMLQAASVWTTEDGRETPWPTANDTSNEGALVGENTASDEQDVTFGAAIFRSYKATSKIVRVAHELMRDSSLDLAGELGRILGERLGRSLNRYCTVGTAAAQPQGVVVGSTLGVTAASATAIAMDELIRLQHSVDAAYRVGPSAGFMMNDSTASYVRRLKDGDGQYLWQSNVQAGQPPLLLGFPVFINANMADIATGAKSVLFGDFSRYKIRQVGQVRLKRLVERYAEYDQEGLLAFLEFDGMILNAGGNPIKHLIQA